MIVEQWGISETSRFRDDVLHLQPSEASLRSWRENIRRDPLIGEPAEDGTGIGEYEYVVGDLVIRYILVPQQRHVILMLLRRRAEGGPSKIEMAGKLWRILREAVGLWSSLKWW
jgi:hypothetical protein